MGNCYHFPVYEERVPGLEKSCEHVIFKYTDLTGVPITNNTINNITINNITINNNTINNNTIHLYIYLANTHR